MQRSRLPLGLLLVFLVLLLDLLAAAPSLHEWFHPDAGQADHHCVVTLFTHGKVDTASVDVPVPVPVTFVATVPTVEICCFRPAIEHLPAGRAPPAAASHS